MHHSTSVTFWLLHNINYIYFSVSTTSVAITSVYLKPLEHLCTQWKKTLETGLGSKSLSLILSG